MLRSAALLVTVLTVAPAGVALAGPKPTVAARPISSPVVVVEVHPDAGQAVVIDPKTRREVTVNVGQQVAGYTLIEVEDSGVTLVARGKQIVLAVQPRPSAPIPPTAPTVATPSGGSTAFPQIDATGMVVAPAPAPATKPVAKPPVRPTAANPSPSPAPAPAAPVGPVAPAVAPPTPIAPAPVAPTPIAPTTPAGPIAPVPAPIAPAPATPIAPTPASPSGEPMDPYGSVEPTPSDPYAKEPAPEDPYRPVSPSPIAPTAAPAIVEITRRDVTAALEDFGSVVLSVNGELTPQGGRIDAIVPGSLLARLGLRAGDVVTAIDGKPLRTLDDAAALYARVSAAPIRSAMLAIIRGGKPSTIKVVVKADK